MYFIRLAHADEVSAVYSIEAASHEPWDAIGYDFLDASMNQRQGIGRALLDATCLAAKESGYSFIALTTYRDVPFNRPWYERNGFSVISEADIGPDLAAVREHERRIGLDQRPRVCMRKVL